MKKILLVGLWVMLTSFIIMFLIPTKVISQKVEVIKIEKPKDPLTTQQRAWLGALEWCESGGNTKAINPKDRDNTPSYGLLQFKPSTLTYYEKMYGVKGQLMDGTVQEKIVEQMIIRGGINWSHEFPDCSKRLGYPPKS